MQARVETMRVKFQGKRSLEELKEELRKCLEQMEILGINYVTGTNLYFNPVDNEGQELIIHLQDGTPIDGWAYIPPKKIQKAKSAKILKLAINNDTKSSNIENQKKENS